MTSDASVDLEWKVTYVGCAESEEHDQVLEEVLVGPVPMGVNKFVLQVNRSPSTCGGELIIIVSGPSSRS